MEKKKLPRDPDPVNVDRWMVSYADFVTLLFAFFTVLFAVSQTDRAKYHRAVENIQRSFLSAGGVFPLKGAPFVPFDKTTTTGSEVPPAMDDMGPFPKTSHNETTGRMAEQIRGLFEKTTGLGVRTEDVEVIQNAEGYKIRLSEAVLYKPGSDKLRREDLPFLYDLGRRLARLPATFQVEGHSDQAPYSTPQGNWQISLSRATNLARFFVEGAEVPPNKVALAGFGDTTPLADNGTPEGRARNRRVEIQILSPQRTIPISTFEP
jgi:chemotaxis protein MotB